MFKINMSPDGNTFETGYSSFPREAKTWCAEVLDTLIRKLYDWDISYYLYKE